MLIKSGILQEKYPNPPDTTRATFKTNLFFLIVSAASLGKAFDEALYLATLTNDAALTEDASWTATEQTRPNPTRPDNCNSLAQPKQ